MYSACRTAGKEMAREPIAKNVALRLLESRKVRRSDVYGEGPINKD
jgi:hypothetical protein